MILNSASLAVGPTSPEAVKVTVSEVQTDIIEPEPCVEVSVGGDKT